MSGNRNTNRQELKISTKAQVERLKYKYKRQKLKTYRNKLKLDLNKIDMIEKEVNLERREVTIERKNLELIMKEQKNKQTGERPEINEQRQKRMYLDSSYIHKQKLLHDNDSGGVEAETYMSITNLKKRGYEFMSNKKILHDRTESAIRSRQD